MSRRYEKYWRPWLSNKQEKSPEPKVEIPPFMTLTISLADEPENISVLPKPGGHDPEEMLMGV